MRVLSIDDDALNQGVIRSMLGVVGVDMVEACGAETGLAMVDGEELNAILMDLRMPGMDGLTAVRLIRARGDAKADVPIIIVTAETGLHLRETCLAAGADEMLQKPIAMAKLFAVLGETVGRRGTVVIG